MQQRYVSIKHSLNVDLIVCWSILRILHYSSTSEKLSNSINLVCILNAREITQALSFCTVPFHFASLASVSERTGSVCSVPPDSTRSCPRSTSAWPRQHWDRERRHLVTHNSQHLQHCISEWIGNHGKILIWTATIEKQFISLP